MRRHTTPSGFSWPRVFGIAGAVAVHAGLGLWAFQPADLSPAAVQGSETLVWESAPHVPVALPPPPQQPAASANALPPSPLDVYTPPTEAQRQIPDSRIGRAQLRSEWHADPTYQATPSNPLDRPTVLEHTATRFDDAWISDGTVVDQLAHRYRAVALVRAATGYQKPCTELEKRQQLPRCFPKTADPRG